jgi:hypothetical protein
MILNRDLGDIDAESLRGKPIAQFSFQVLVLVG